MKWWPLVMVMTFLGGCSNGTPTHLSAEEKRVDQAYQALPALADRLRDPVEAFGVKLFSSSDSYALGDMVEQHGNALWQAAVKDAAERADYDDRALYWTRLQMTRLLRSSSIYKLLPGQDQQQLLWWLELASRGNADIRFADDADVKILLTGFDPFFLDRNIAQSNPSGVAALLLDGAVFDLDGRKVQIESYILPVRFGDFDQGMVEAVMAPLLEKQGVDMIVTVSMGREEFDLERFPGLRRSAEAPDNLNVYTGATKAEPQVPLLKGEPLSGPEFVEFSLPVDAMLAQRGTFPVNDNHHVTTLSGEHIPQTLAGLEGETSVSGSGGGYLSNEVSYRSIRLRNLHQPELPVGHIHTPRITEHDPLVLKSIVDQVRELVLAAATTITD